MPKHVSEFKIVLRITATYFSNQLKMESLNQETATPETEEKLKNSPKPNKKPKLDSPTKSRNLNLDCPNNPELLLLRFSSKRIKKQRRF